MFQPAGSISIWSFLVVCFVVLAALLVATWASASRDSASRLNRTLVVALGTAVWLSLVCGVVFTGWAEVSQTRTLIFILALNLVSIGVGLSPIGGWLASSPITWLVAFQGFRLPLELVLHSWVGQGVIPTTMTWTGANWDIVSGVTALVLAPFVRRLPALAWVANGVGLLLLVNVMRVALFSSPVPFGWPVTPKLEVVYHVPYVLILPICVGGAIIGHIALTRALIFRSTR